MLTHKRMLDLIEIIYDGQKLLNINIDDNDEKFLTDLCEEKDEKLSKLVFNCGNFKINKEIYNYTYTLSLDKFIDDRIKKINSILDSQK